MKIWTVILMFISLSVYAENNDFKGYPEGLLTFSESIPLELDATNKRGLLDDQEGQIVRNLEIEQAKTFPLEKLLLTLVAFLVFLFLRYFPRESKEDLIAIKTAGEHAEQKLELLQGENLNLEQQYEKLVYILQIFIEERYGINAPTKTTEEFLDGIKDISLSGLKEPALSQILEISDLVKYAKKNPTDLDYRRAYDLVNQIIKI